MLQVQAEPYTGVRHVVAKSDLISIPSIAYIFILSEDFRPVFMQESVHHTQI